VTPGTTYQATFTVSGFSGTHGVQAGFTGGTSVTSAAYNANGTHTAALTAVAGNNAFRLIPNGPDCNATIDNLTLREVESLTDAEITSARTLLATRAGVTL
jgi:hypothetical protein